MRQLIFIFSFALGVCLSFFLSFFLSSQVLSCIFPFSDYKEYHTDTTVKFVITLTESKMSEAESVGFHKKFKLETAVNTTNLVCTCVCTCTLYMYMYMSTISISIISLRQSISIFYLYLSTSIVYIHVLYLLLHVHISLLLYMCSIHIQTHTHTLTHMYTCTYKQLWYFNFQVIMVFDSYRSCLMLMVV